MKVSNAVVCLDCDELFLEVRDSCPFCGSITRVFLRRYFPSLHTYGTLKQFDTKPPVKAAGVPAPPIPLMRQFNSVIADSSKTKNQPLALRR